MTNEGLSLLGRGWQARDVDARSALTLAQKLDVDPLAARLLAARGVSLDDAPHFLEPRLKYLLPDPFVLKDMDKVVDRLYCAVSTQEKIVIFGDYDVDGATSSALLFHILNALSLKADIYIPDRLKEGYGPNAAAIERFHAQGATLVITLDCGTTAFEALERAHALGLDVIVIDHHEAEPRLPPACGVINPNRLDEDAPEIAHLAAVGVTFLVLVALFSHIRAQRPNASLPSLLNYLDLVALGTVCDVVPLTGLNRAFVAQGLKVMAQRGNIGLSALMDVSALREKPGSYHLGFLLGPRINAGGRVGEACLGARLLTTQDPFVAKEIAARLDALNIQRQALEEEALEEATLQAMSQLKNRCIIVSSNAWHPGIIGILAGRLKEQFHKPTFAISFWSGDTLGKGSGRSVTGIGLGSLVHTAKQKNLIDGGGGHAMAAGLSLTKEQLVPFQAFCEERLISLGDAPLPLSFYDGTLPLEACHIALVDALETLSPFGQGNPSPRFVLENIWVESATPVGKGHLKCHLRSSSGHTLDAMAFRCLETALGRSLLAVKEAFHVLGSLKKNEWQGRVKAQFMIEDAILSAQANRFIETQLQEAS